MVTAQNDAWRKALTNLEISDMVIAYKNSKIPEWIKHKPSPVCRQCIVSVPGMSHMYWPETYVEAIAMGFYHMGIPFDVCTMMTKPDIDEYEQELEKLLNETQIKVI